MQISRALHQSGVQVFSPFLASFPAFDAECSILALFILQTWYSAYFEGLSEIRHCWSWV